MYEFEGVFDCVGGGSAWWCVYVKCVVVIVLEYCLFHVSLVLCLSGELV